MLRLREERPDLDLRWAIFTGSSSRRLEARTSAQRFLGADGAERSPRRAAEGGGDHHPDHPAGVEPRAGADPDDTSVARSPGARCHTDPKPAAPTSIG